MTAASPSTAKVADVAAFVTDPDSVETIQRLFNELMMPHTLVRRGDLDAAIDYLRAVPRAPRQLIVDVSGSEMPISEMSALADVCEPDVSVVVVGDRNDIGLFRDLMRMGVTDYLAKPLTASLLRRTLSFHEHRAEPVRQARSGRLVTLVGARGGVGTTTIAMNLSSALSTIMGRRVALADFDVNGRVLSTGLNVKPAQGLTDVLHNASRLDEVFLDHAMVQHGQRLFVLANQGAPHETPILPSGSVETAINFLAQHYHYVISDVPHREGALLQKLLDESHLTMIVADPTVASARSVSAMLQMQLRGSTQRTLVVLNHVRPPARGDVLRADFETAIGRPIDFELPFAGSTAVEAENLGQLLVDRKGPLSEALVALAQDLSGVASPKAKGVKAGLRKVLNYVWPKA